MITGMVSWPPVAHSFRSVIPSASGIQISSNTRSGRLCARSGGILGKLHRVPFIGEDFRQQLADPDFVVDDQYLRHGRSGGKRKRNPHRRAATPFFPDAVFYPNCAVMLVDDALYDREPQSRAFGLGSDIGLECPVDDGLGEAATVVADPQPHLAARKLGRHFDFRVAASEK